VEWWDWDKRKRLYPADALGISWWASFECFALRRSLCVASEPGGVHGCSWFVGTCGGGQRGGCPGFPLIICRTLEILANRCEV